MRYSIFSVATYNTLHWERVDILQEQNSTWWKLYIYTAANILASTSEHLSPSWMVSFWPWDLPVVAIYICQLGRLS